MYRKPIMTRGDAENLVGRLVRLEWSGRFPDHVGIVTEFVNDVVRIEGPDNPSPTLRVLNGYWLVFATTHDSMPPDEVPFVEQVNPAHLLA